LKTVRATRPVRSHGNEKPCNARVFWALHFGGGIASRGFGHLLVTSAYALLLPVPPKASRRTTSSFSAASACNDGVTCEYRSIVIAIVEWPSIS
jgi:hypothetical protein